MTLHVFTDTSYNYNYKLDTMHMQSMCLGTMHVMQYTKQLTCDCVPARVVQPIMTVLDTLTCTKSYGIYSFGIQTYKATK